MDTTNPEINAQTKVPEIMGILITGIILSTVGVVLRIWTRVRIIGAAGADDWIMVFAQVLALGEAAAIGLETRYGMGRHIWTIASDELVLYFKTFYASVLVYNASLTLVKISILMQYRRIFTTRGIQKATVVGLVVISVWGVANLILLSLLCIPIQSLWDLSIKGKCLPRIPAYFAPGSINIATDFAIFAIPLPVIRSLQLPRRQKYILYFIFGIGFFTCCISFIRLSTLKEAATSDDQTWANVDAALWSFLELSFAIFTACLPTLRPLVAKILPRIIGSSLDSAERSGGNFPRSQTGYGGLQRKPQKLTIASRSDSTEELQGNDTDFALHRLRSDTVPGMVYSATATRGSVKESQSVDGDSPESVRSRATEKESSRGAIRATTVVSYNFSDNV